jgi:broad specificity phosphatase PhoE
MTIFYLLRHGSRVSRHEDTLLSETGLTQAKLTAEYLQNHNVGAIYASPLPRTQQTAQIITTKLKLPIITDPRLTERMVFDETKRENFGEFLQEWDKTMANRTYQPTYGDSSNSSGERLKNLLDEVTNQHINVFVSHAGVIGDLLRTVFTDQMLPFQDDPVASLKWVPIRECSITEIHKENNVYTLKRVNDTNHLVK